MTKLGHDQVRSWHLYHVSGSLIGGPRSLVRPFMGLLEYLEQEPVHRLTKPVLRVPM